MDKYLSHHSGEELDEVVSMVRNHGLGKLEHDRGIFISAEILPIDATEGDYAYVGLDYGAMMLYTYHNGWYTDGQTVDLYQKNNVILQDIADKTEYTDVF